MDWGGVFSFVPCRKSWFNDAYKSQQRTPVSTVRLQDEKSLWFEQGLAKQVKSLLASLLELRDTTKKEMERDMWRKSNEDLPLERVSIRDSPGIGSVIPHRCMEGRALMSLLCCVYQKFPRFKLLKARGETESSTLQLEKELLMPVDPSQHGQAFHYYPGFDFDSRYLSITHVSRDAYASQKRSRSGLRPSARSLFLDGQALKRLQVS